MQQNLGDFLVLIENNVRKITTKRWKNIALWTLQNPNTLVNKVEWSLLKSSTY